MSAKTLESKLATLGKQLERSLRLQVELEERIEHIVEEKTYEIKAIAYLLLLISTALFALVLGMMLNALGFRL